MTFHCHHRNRTMQQSACHVCHLRKLCGNTRDEEGGQGRKSGSMISIEAALELRHSGKTWEAVAFEMGVSTGSACKAVKKFELRRALGTL